MSISISTKKKATRTRDLSVLVLGDVHGDFMRTHQWLDQARQTHQIDAIFAVGDVEAIHNADQMVMVHGPEKYRKMGSYPQVLDGSIVFDLPFLFIGGNHEPWEALDAAAAASKPNTLIAWGPNIWFLGRSGSTTLLVGEDNQGLSIAWLSGIYSPKVSPQHPKGRLSPRARTYYSLDELNKVKSNAVRPLDMLLTHDWPTGSGLTGRGGGLLGDDNLRELNVNTAPKVHVCGHIHTRNSFTINQRMVEGVGHTDSTHGASIVTFKAGEDALVEVTDLVLDRNTHFTH